MAALLGEPGGVQEGSGDGRLFPWGPHWETWERAHTLATYVWKKVLGWVSLHVGTPLGNLRRGGPSTRNFENQLNDGTSYGASLCMAALLGEPGEGGSFPMDPVGYERKALETGISVHGGSVGQPGAGLSTGDFERWLKGALGSGACL